MKIRKMEIADYDEVHSLWMSCKGMGLNDIDDSKRGIEIFLHRNPKTCFVAEEDANNRIYDGIKIIFVYEIRESPQHIIEILRLKRGDDILAYEFNEKNLEITFSNPENAFYACDVVGDVYKLEFDDRNHLLYIKSNSFWIRKISAKPKVVS